MNATSSKNEIPADNVGYLIGDVSRMIRTVYDRHVEPLGLTRAQWRVMVYLNRLENCTQTELANALEIEKPTLGKHVERLEAKGWVTRQPDARDARSKILSLTPAARPVLDTMFERANQVLDGIFDGIGSEDADRLTATLMQIKSNLTGMMDAQSATRVTTGAED